MRALKAAGCSREQLAEFVIAGGWLETGEMIGATHPKAGEGVSFASGQINISPQTLTARCVTCEPSFSVAEFLREWVTLKTK